MRPGCSTMNRRASPLGAATWTGDVRPLATGCRRGAAYAAAGAAARAAGREERDGTHPRMVPRLRVPSPPQRGGQMAPSMRSTASAAGGKPAPAASAATIPRADTAASNACSEPAASRVCAASSAGWKLSR